MVIHSALFSPAPGPSLNCSHHTAHSSALTSDNGLTSGAPPGTAHAQTDIRQAVTRRCSGYSRGEDCKFSLLLDVVESETWGGGLVTISHTCSHTKNIRQDCQQDNNQVRNNLSLPSV